MNSLTKENYLKALYKELCFKIKIKRIESLDKSVVVSYGKRQAQILSNVVCERILVEKEM
jgi:hypothetical protein